METSIVLNKLVLDIGSQLHLQQQRLVDGAVPPTDGYTVTFKKLLKLSNIHTCSTSLDRALERQWLELRLCTRLNNQSSAAIFTKMNKSLACRTFLASDKLTLVDVLWAFSLAPFVASLTFNEKESLINTTRWFIQTVEAIANAIGTTPGCTLLDVDPGSSTNRTVYTFVGSPDDVVKGAMAGALAASHLIDMSTHTGEHLRVGALDVCPFIPVQDVTMEECVQCANKFAEALAATLNVPVYLYGHASTQDYRKTVPQIRAGQYEGLEEKLELPKWKPDYGPAEFVPSWGATIVGARDFLVAYNVNLLGTKEQAHRIACIIREQGKPQPERLPGVQAMGWYLLEASLAQISMNLSNISVTPMHVAYEAAVKQAEKLNLSVVGSEVVGVLPKSSLLAAAEYYIERDQLFILEEEQKIRLAIDKLGLHSYKHFEPKEKIIENMLEGDNSEPLLSNLLLKDFVRAVSSRTAAPGGGSVAALVGALGSGLGAMAALLTYGYKRFEDLDQQMRKLIPPLHKLSQSLVPKIDADSFAFTNFMEAAKLSANTEEEKERKSEAQKEALYNAIAVPFSVAKDINTLWGTLRELSPIVNIQCVSDIQVAVRCLQTAVWAAYYNVTTNAKNVEDAEYKNQIISDISDELKIMESESKAILEVLDKRT